MSNYTELSEKIINAVGGTTNISVVNHCATRLRITVKNEDLVRDAEIKNIKGVLGLVKHGNELQIVIGTDVGNVFREIIKNSDVKKGNIIDENLDQNLKSNKGDKSGQKGSGKAFRKVVDFISGTFVPVLPVLVAAGLVSAVLNILVTFFGLPAEGGTYTILSAINNAGFYFLPVFIGYSAANKLAINPFMGAYLGAILLHGSINNAEALDFFGIAVPQVSYGSSVIPILLGVLFMAVVYRFISKGMPKEISFFATPLLTILIVTPITLILLGPLGNFIGGYIADSLNFINQRLGWLSVGLMGALTPILVMTGTNQALFPLVFAAMADNGYDAFVMPGMLAANVAVGASALAVAIRIKNKNDKALALSAGITGVMGITEPSIFGVLINNKKAFLGAIVGGAVGGLFAGIVQLKQYAIVSPGIAAVPTFIPTDGSGLTSNFWLSIVTILISVTVAFVFTYFSISQDTELL
ncbi:PTS transporter subunit EIIC [Fusibacter bizertensis]